MKQLQRASGIVKGSLQDVAEAEGISLQEAMLGAEIIVVLDQSGSMNAADARGNRVRRDVATEELEKIQARYPGKVVLVEFADDVRFCYDGRPSGDVGFGTDMVNALNFVKVGDGAFRIVVISDGCPDSEDGTIRVAATFTSPIDTIFIGPEGDAGEDFLARLSRKTGGQRFVADKPGELAPGIIALLGGG